MRPIAVYHHNTPAVLLRKWLTIGWEPISKIDQGSYQTKDSHTFSWILSIPLHLKQSTHGGGANEWCCAKAQPEHGARPF